ncbi:hypothetical protein BDZ91DRAFT_800073 [Kalaharituber pfeilii]|nr:hypothetical protein BDZ91DRAFT_800073 [Kalaharituber pfeilii]
MATEMAVEMAAAMAVAKRVLKFSSKYLLKWQRLGNRAATLAGIIGGKGLRHLKFKIGTADGPECRWCGEDYETPLHVPTQCRVWKRKCPRGMEGLCRLTGNEDEDLTKILDWARDSGEALGLCTKDDSQMKKLWKVKHLAENEAQNGSRTYIQSQSQSYSHSHSQSETNKATSRIMSKDKEVDEISKMMKELKLYQAKAQQRIEEQSHR